MSTTEPMWGILGQLSLETPRHDMKIIDVHTHLYWQNGHDSGRQIPHAPPGSIGPEAYVEAFDRSRLAGEGRMVISPGSGLEEFKQDPDMVRRANDAVAKLVAMAPDRSILGCGPDPFRLEDTLALMKEPVAQRGAEMTCPRQRYHSQSHTDSIHRR